MGFFVDTKQESFYLATELLNDSILIYNF